MLIQVTQEDINEADETLNLVGGISYQRHCPVAQAIYRQHQKSKGRRPRVDPIMIEINDGYYFIGEFFYTPDNVKEFITRYDHKLPVVPFEFELKE